mmetsp:Transcript_144138/g.461451  ORF Transcript_144138/g.461451 Transcript_144138/m.461451 type:complete len:211 (-) Transcript_144138:2-634(-)
MRTASEIDLRSSSMSSKNCGKARTVKPSPRGSGPRSAFCVFSLKKVQTSSAHFFRASLPSLPRTSACSSLPVSDSIHSLSWPWNREKMSSKPAEFSIDDCAIAGATPPPPPLPPRRGATAAAGEGVRERFWEARREGLRLPLRLALPAASSLSALAEATFGGGDGGKGGGSSSSTSCFELPTRFFKVITMGAILGAGTQPARCLYGAETA